MSPADMDALETADRKAYMLRLQIEQAESQLRLLKLQLHEAELSANGVHQLHLIGGTAGNEINVTDLNDQEAVDEQSAIRSDAPNASQKPGSRRARWPLEQDEYKRYGRQLIMPQIGSNGQLRLKNAKVLIIGVGGLGCPAATYLAGAGVGTLGLMDGDTVEVSNLHRQIAHSTSRVGWSKVDSAYESLRSLNPLVNYKLYPVHLSPERAISLFEAYDLILDCTDRPTSRYLISDACVLAGKSLVSASALKTDGQLIVLNNPPRTPGDMKGGPCYRCIFPKPPPADSVLSCGEGGILGPVVGTMGVLQALEAIKVLTDRAADIEGSVEGTKEPVKPSMLMFSAYTDPQFRSVRLRSRRSNCAICSAEPSITNHSLTSGSLDYVTFCGVTAPINVLSSQARVSAKDLAGSQDSKLIVDVRDETQFAICALEGSVNVPWTGNGSTWLNRAKQNGVLNASDKPTYIVCRFGNDSQLAAEALLEQAALGTTIKDLRGGFQSWQSEVDSEWPDY